MCNRKPFIWIKTFACKIIIHTVQGHRSKGLSTKAHCGTALAILTKGEYIIYAVNYSSNPRHKPDRNMDMCSPKDETEGS